MWTHAPTHGYEPTGEASPMGMVGLDWQVGGFGNFSSLGESDMVMRNTKTGALEAYDISNNQITNAFAIGMVGIDWQFSGVGDFSSNPGETDLLMRNSKTGGLEVYTTSPTTRSLVHPSWARWAWIGNSRASRRCTPPAPPTWCCAGTRWFGCPCAAGPSATLISPC
jgi:hypothetical protein